RVVVIAVEEITEKVVAWGEAGVAGYIPRTASVADIVPLLVEIMRGEQTCSANVAAGLLHRLSNVGTSKTRDQRLTLVPVLTTRESEIAQMIAAGMSNKEIARSLNIGLSTAKTHVHHLLGKLNFQRRGQAANWMRGRQDRC